MNDTTRRSILDHGYIEVIEHWVVAKVPRNWPTFTSLTPEWT